MALVRCQHEKVFRFDRMLARLECQDQLCNQLRGPSRLPPPQRRFQPPSQRRFQSRVQPRLDPPNADL